MHWHFDGHAVVLQSDIAGWIAGASRPHLVFAHIRTGNAFGEGSCFAQFAMHALSPQAQASAHDWPAAQVASARQSLTWDAQFCSMHWHVDGHAVVLQSGIAGCTAGASRPQFVLAHIRIGNAFGDGSFLAHAAMHALSPQAQASAHDWPAAQVASARQSLTWD